jgi:hypothetical protein
MSHPPEFAVTFSLSVLVLVFLRCLFGWTPGVEYPPGPAWFLYVEAAGRAAIDAFVVLVTSYLGLRWSNARTIPKPTRLAMLLAIPMAAIGLLEHRVHIPVTTYCGDGLVCNPYGLQIWLESQFHLLVLAVASALVTFVVGRRRGSLMEQPPPNKSLERTRGA